MAAVFVHIPGLGCTNRSGEALILYRLLVPLILLVIAAGAVASGIVHLTVGALKLLFAALVLLFLLSLVTGPRRRR